MDHKVSFLFVARYRLPQRLLRVVGLLAGSAGPFPLSVCCRSFADAWRGEAILLDARRYKALGGATADARLPSLLYSRLLR